jgi:hypothetical protein
LPEFFAKLNFPVGEPETFVIHPHVFGGEMQTSWKEWADLLFVRSFRTEAALMHELQVECEPKITALLDDARLAE